MGLEYWDAGTRKYVLYQNSKQHEADCERFPFENIPKRVFLDTNVLNVLVKQSEHIFDNQFIPDHIEPSLALDAEALMHVFYVGSRANWDLLGSPKTLNEISRTKDAALRDDLLDYALGIVNYGVSDEDRAFAEDFGRRLVDAPFVAALPDVADRELIGNAIGLRCDVFCTCDRATIVSKRNHLTQLPLKIMTPSEWWAQVKPWAGLWC